MLSKSHFDVSKEDIQETSRKKQKLDNNNMVNSVKINTRSKDPSALKDRLKQEQQNSYLKSIDYNIQDYEKVEIFDNPSQDNSVNILNLGDI